MWCERRGVKRGCGVGRGRVEWSRGEWNWWCRGEMGRYEEEEGWGREVCGVLVRVRRERMGREED